MEPPIFFTGRMPFLPPNQQRQSTEGNYCIRIRGKTLEFSSTVLPAPSPYLKGMVGVALVSLDGVAPSRMVGVSASVNLPLHHKAQKFSSGTVSPGWSRKKGRKTVVVVMVLTVMDAGIGDQRSRKTSGQSKVQMLRSFLIDLFEHLLAANCATLV